MKIVINTNSLLTPLTGIGQYTYQISEALKKQNVSDEFTYYYGFFSPELFRATQGNAEPSIEQKKINFYKRMKSVIKKIPIVGKFGRDLRTSLNFSKQWLTGKRYDLYFEPNFIPLREVFARKTVTMVFDLSVLLYPEWHPEDRVKTFKRQFLKGLKKSHQLLTSTEFIKGQMLEHLNLRSEQIAVTPISCNKNVFHPRPRPDARARLIQLKVPQNYLVFVGSVEPRKNILGLLKGYAMLEKELRRDLSIVFCGPEGWKNREVYDFIAENGLMENILWMHYISDEDLSLLYQNARALVYPSFYEGFGLPPLEAMSSGCPVIASDIGPHREVCGHAAHYVNPQVPEEITSAIQKLICDSEYRDQMRELGLAQSKKFSWEKAARQTLEVFRAISES